MLHIYAVNHRAIIMTQSRRRDVIKAAGGVVALGTLGGCAQEGAIPENDPFGPQQAGSDELSPQEESGEGGRNLGVFRVVHAVPDAPDITVLFDSEVGFEEIDFDEVSSYATVQPGTYRVRIVDSDDRQTVLFDQQITVEAGAVTTAVVYGETSENPAAASTVEILSDDLSNPGEGSSRLRLFHAVADAPPVDIVIAQAPETDESGQESGNVGLGPSRRDGLQQQQPSEPSPGVGDPLFEGLAYGEHTTVKVPAGEYTLDIFPASSGGGATSGNDSGIGTGGGNNSSEDSDNGLDGGNGPEVGGGRGSGNSSPSGPGGDPVEPSNPGGGGDSGGGNDVISALQNINNGSDSDNGGGGSGSAVGGGGGGVGGGDGEAGRSREPITSVDVELERGGVYSAFAIGYLDPLPAGSQEVFELVVVEDSMSGERSSGGTD